MKRNAVRWWLILTLVTAVYNVVAFALPFAKTSVFFISWGFTLAAIVAQVYVIYTAFGRGGSVKSKFYGYPIARIGGIYLLIQMVSGLIFMALGKWVPFWVPLALDAILLGGAAIGFIAADAARDEVVRQDVQLQRKVSTMRDLQSQMAAAAQLAEEGQLRGILEKFAEELRFSDPVSSEGTAAAEAALSSCVEELCQAADSGDLPTVIALEKKARSLLTERNRLCRLGKGKG